MESFARPYRRHPESPVGRIGRIRERVLERQGGPWLVLVPHVYEVQGMRRRLHPRETELGHLPDRLENRPQLRPHGLDLILGNLQARQLGDVQHVLTRDAHEGSSLEMRRAPGRGPSTALEL